ncbi:MULTISPECIES: helix-turn-helix transcriptional regulator [unclassified Streptomyces]|uniref:helix-turn-helix transcriptional regulator n=1 Tax=unclassified Streptomyces TaxID=2593676 RepID=UPI002E819D82|nr:helix-turn-helix transcriptional regulator [Streptomyces sp. NBC_00589]WTI37627.1 helix-turn-helix transcriptional regulator [Streptomyces sp. NBC_00775]WUB28695.1 helix-turn-helix transcriptional regulator [Streptomyces sp. NBC_00589]
MNQTHGHGVADLCEVGRQLYAEALRLGRIPRADVSPAPCLVEFALLQPDPDDPDLLRPVSPIAALAQRLHPIEREIQERRHLAISLTDSFEPFMSITAQDRPTTHAITVLEGMPRINEAIQRATAECRSEILTVQPGGGRPEDVLNQAAEIGHGIIERGIVMRTLYQHTARHSQGTLEYAEQMAQGKVEIRTLEELIERLMIFDREVAFIPAQDDRRVALELRHPGLVQYLVKVFEQLWRRAVPLLAQTPYAPPTDGISGVQRSIAHLLVEGHVDEAIARRLGMNVRTCRAHIAKLAAALGSGSRAQLGYLIAQSGLLDKDS